MLRWSRRMDPATTVKPWTNPFHAGVEVTMHLCGNRVLLVFGWSVSQITLRASVHGRGCNEAR